MRWRRIWDGLLGRTRFLGMDSWERVSFDFAHYSPIRKDGYTHKQAVKELDRLWARRG